MIERFKNIFTDWPSLVLGWPGLPPYLFVREAFELILIYTVYIDYGVIFTYGRLFKIKVQLRSLQKKGEFQVLN